MTPPPLSADPPRSAATAHWPGWADKRHETFVKKPLRRRAWFRRLLWVLLLTALVVGSIASLLLLHWYRVVHAELARQQHGVETFVQSPAFEAFAHEIDAQLVASLNFATLRSNQAGGLLPEVTAAEKTRHQLPWSLELAPLPVSTATHPARVRAALRTATDLLARRGFTFDDARRDDARRVFLRVLAPHARTFVAGRPEAEFPALAIDRRLQDRVLAAYAARAGGTSDDAERALVFYSLVGPSLWREIGPPGDTAKTGA